MAQELPENLNHIKTKLLKERLKIKLQLKSLENTGPHSPDSLPEAQDVGSVSWETDVYSGIIAVKNRLLDLLSKTERTIQTIEKGVYGKCEKCLKEIGQERLHAFPLATSCNGCF